MNHLILQANARRIPLADRSVHCVVTSIPYFNLRDYEVEGQIGLEATPEAFVAAIVAAFREVRRVLRDDGTVFLNVGDTYYSGKGSPKGVDPRSAGRRHRCKRPVDGPGLPLRRKNLLLIPARVALGLQSDGWILRSEIIWNKPNAMPGTAQDRPGVTHETVYLLAKKLRYYYDNVATRTPQKTLGRRHEGKSGYRDGHPSKGGIKRRALNPLGAAERSIWSISTQPRKEAHFALMAPKLAAKCVMLGTSQEGCCPACGAPWHRVVERHRYASRPDRASKYQGVTDRVGHDRGRHLTEVIPVGWRPGCRCPDAIPVPCRVLDPFAGLLTTAVVADSLGRDSVSLDLSRGYLLMGRERLERPHAPKAKAPAAPGRPMPLFARRAAR